MVIFFTVCLIIVAASTIFVCTVAVAILMGIWGTRILPECKRR